MTLIAVCIAYEKGTGYIYRALVVCDDNSYRLTPILSVVENISVYGLRVIVIW